ncbi:TRAP transporter substrate-binding protein [Portibacter lacus]|uniref:C4-dicarboxylate ABC transporter substrate-binding protein n=1 Tax=Portibacter lacus TaxID=1099794 RepID=A0AA37SYT1_9BACT|nr:TRAP transporter substrate-binding protein [Portibacter lacus]GLR20030.1 C4-dicarboxylate ABC transporter substrate-binding protein [Portibacter lacus]
MVRLLVFVSFFFSIISCNNVVDHKRVLLAHTLPITHPVHKGMEVFAEEAERISGGKVIVKIFPDGQLGTEREVLELLQIGSISMTKVSAAAMANFAPEYKVLGIPYLFRDKEHLFKVLEGPTGQAILDAGSDYLLKGMCFYDAGSRSFYTKEKPIKEPSDLDGMKIRVMSDQMSVNMVNALGGSATPMAYGELYTALQQGVVDGAENNPPSFVTSRHYEICKYYSLDEHSSLPDVLVMGTKFWSTLDDQEKEWVEQAAKTSAIAQKRFWKENVEECMVILKEAGVTVIKPDKTLFAEKAKSVVEKFASDPAMKKVVEEIQNQ